MKLLKWEECPAEIKRQAGLIALYMRDFFGDALRGVYLHGSACLGAFRPGRSDLDLLIVVTRPLSAEERFRLMCAFLSLHRQPAPIEASILQLDDLKAWKHPAPYQFHFSEFWRKRYEALEAREDYSFWTFQEERHDPDLACHVKLAREYGIALCGPPPGQVFPSVPEEHVMDSLHNDARDAIRGAKLYDAHAILTLARVWSYMELRSFLSKSEAAQWAIQKLGPGTEQRIIVDAFSMLDDEAASVSFRHEEFDVCVDHMLGRIFERREAERSALPPA